MCMKDLRDLLNESINLIKEVYDFALIDEIDNVRNKSSILINKLNKLFPTILEAGLQINPIMIMQVENLLDASGVGDCIGVIDIVEFEMKPILEEYLESIGE